MNPANSTTVITYGSAWIACTGTDTPPMLAPCRRIDNASRKPNSTQAIIAPMGCHLPKIIAASAM